jgi:hypothetical protein
MIRLPLSIAFKGGRDYLQGPDLLAGLLGALRESGRAVDGALDVAFYNKTGHQPDVSIQQADDPPAKPGDAIGQWSAHCGERHERGWFLQSARPVNGRHPYDEDFVVAQCVRQADAIGFAGDTSLSATELCVAMTKALHIVMFPLPADRHWVVSRFILARPLAEADKQGMRVELQTTLGTRLTRSALSAGETRLGNLFFSPAPR